jgi:hypothetical protein
MSLMSGPEIMFGGACVGVGHAEALARAIPTPLPSIRSLPPIFCPASTSAGGGFPLAGFGSMTFAAGLLVVVKLGVR